MTALIKSFGSGMTESFNALVDNSLPVALGSIVGGGIGFLIGGAPVAWLAAKIVSLVLGMVYAMGRPTCEIQPNLLSQQNCQTMGNVVVSLGIPPFLITVIHILFG